MDFCACVDCLRCGDVGQETRQRRPYCRSRGPVFVSGSDAPLPSVVSFKVDISGIAVAEGMGTPVTVTTGTQTVDFAKLNGLHTLLDLNTIAAGNL